MLQRSFAAERPAAIAGARGAAPAAPVRPTSAPRRARRRLRRLLSMSPVEIAHRAAERLRIEADRRRARHRGMAVAPGGELDLGRGAARILFEPTAAHRCAVTTWLASRSAAGQSELQREAEELLAHRVRLFAFGAVELGPEIDWHLDPLAGARWEIRFFGDYDLVNGDGPDPKIVHELGRHGHLTRLAAAYYTIGDERYARECVAQILSWIEQSPPGWGIHWTSSLEAALRVLAWMTTLALLSPSAALPAEASARIGASLREQLAHIRRYLSLYSSPNTHLLGEAAALYLGGRFLGESGAAGEWKQEGARLLERELGRQVGEDGVYGEPSTYYHAYALDFYLMALAAARRDDPALAARLSPKVARMADFLAAVSRADGSMPAIGDDDGGTAFPLAGPCYDDVRDLLSGAAVACRRPDLFRPTATQRALWLFGPDAVDETARVAAALVDPPSRVDFPEAGLFRQPIEVSGRRSEVLFDAGGMGIGGCGHAHADTLQLLWEVDGRPVLVDSGTSVYNRAPAWRDYFRSTRAHNTVTVDDGPQSVPAGTFAWDGLARSFLHEPVRRGACQYAGGEHDGYRRLAQPVGHRRHVLALDPHGWVIADVLEGEGRHRLAWTYHFAPDVELHLEDTESLVRVRARGAGGDVVMAFMASTALRARVLEGELSPVQGWVSARYGERRPAPVLELTMDTDVPVAALTVLSPDGRADGLALRRFAGVLELKLGAEGHADEIVLSTARSDDELVWRRRSAGVVTQLLTAGAGGVKRFQSQED